MSKRTHVFLSILIGVMLLGAACDPLAGDPTAVVVLPTPTATRTRPPTFTPAPTATFTPAPPTAIPSATPFACTEPHGQIIKDSFTSRISGAQFAYRVYLPPCYWVTGRRYPYVLLLPGSDGDQSEWTDTLKADQAAESGLNEGRLPPVILIMPDGGDPMNGGVYKEGISFETLLLTELTPLVEKNFCTWNAREGRAIGGISRGGFWAFEIALRHPELYGAVGGHSPFFDPTNAPPAYNPLNLAKNAKFTPGLQPRIWTDAGKDDYARPNIETFQKSLSARGVDPGYTMYPVGQHEIGYWASHVGEYLAFYGQTWPRAVEDLPSCA